MATEFRFSIVIDRSVRLEIGQLAYFIKLHYLKLTLYIQEELKIIDNSNRDQNQDISTNIVADEAAVESGNSQKSATDNKADVPIGSGGYGNVADWNDSSTPQDSSDKSTDQINFDKQSRQD